MATTGDPNELTPSRELSLYRELFEHSNEAIAIIDHEGRYIRQNPAHNQLLGYGDTDLIDKTPAIHLGPTIFQQIVRQLAETGTYFGEHTSRTKTGIELRIELSAFTVPGRDGEPPLFVGIKRDVAAIRSQRQAREDRERMELEESLRQAQKMELIGQLAAGVAHDFNNLLTPIAGYAELGMLAREKNEQPSADIFRQILNAAERGSDLTSQLLAFGRRQVLAMDVLDLREEVDHAAQILRRLIPEDTVIELDLEDGASVVADQTQLQQVIMNLATNARDAMPEGGTIRIALHNVLVGDQDHMVGVLGEAGDYVLLEVSDTGCGMDDATLARVFEPFFTRRPSGKGTGLGLSIVHGIVGQHGGIIEATSEVGRGSNFRIYLPRAQRQRVRKTKPQTSFGEARGETVLVVEDDPQVRALVARVLEGQGYRVLLAIDGTKAMNVARGFSGSIDLLLSDVVMPGPNGLELFAALRDERPDLRVLFMSGYARDALARDGQLDSNIALIEKPFSGSALSSRIREVLRNEPPRREATAGAS